MADDTAALLVRSGLVSAGALAEARDQVVAVGGTLSEHLVDSGAVSDDALTELYLQRLQVPRISASTLARLPVAAVAALPHKMAIALRAIPIARDHNNTLTVALSDPLERHVVDEIAAFTGARVVVAVATQMQIAWCLAHYYDHLTRLGKQLLQPDSDVAPDRRTEGVNASSGRRSRTASGEIRVANQASDQDPELDAEATGEPTLATDAAPALSAQHERDTALAPEPVTGSARAASEVVPRDGVSRSNLRAQTERESPFAIDERSGPRLVVEVHPGRSEDDTAKIVARHRKRPVPQEPPELAARSGEVDLRPGPEPEVTTGPTIVVDLEPPRRGANGDDEGSVPIAVHPASEGSKPSRISRQTATGIAVPTVRVPRATSVGVPLGPYPDIDRPPDDDDTNPAKVIAAVDSGRVRGTSSEEGSEIDRADFDFDATDPSWGPPGSTIPPPLREPYSPLDDFDSDAIPIANLDAQPMAVALSSLTERSRPLTSSESGLTRMLENATQSVLDLIRTLERAADRNTVVTAMIDHLAETHIRAGMFVARGNGLALFSITPPTAAISAATLRLDRHSTLRDVIDARLPYRGPMHDRDSRMFLQAVLGACPPEILLVPIAVRERVVGVLFGEHRTRHTFDDQLALAARVAGMALERILKTKRG